MQVGNFEQTFNTLKKSEQNPPTLHLIPSFPSLQKDSLFNSTHPFLFTLHSTASHTPLTYLTPPLFFFWESLTCGCTDPESSSLAVHVAIFNGWWTGSFCGPSMDVVGPSWMMFPMICLGCHVYGWCINKEHNCWSEREREEREGRILNCDGGGNLIIIIFNFFDLSHVMWQSRDSHLLRILQCQ